MVEGGLPQHFSPNMATLRILSTNLLNYCRNWSTLQWAASDMDVTSWEYHITDSSSIDSKEYSRFMGESDGCIYRVDISPDRCATLQILEPKSTRTMKLNGTYRIYTIPHTIRAVAIARFKDTCVLLETPLHAHLHLHFRSISTGEVVKPPVAIPGTGTSDIVIMRFEVLGSLVGIAFRERNPSYKHITSLQFFNMTTGEYAVVSPTLYTLYPLLMPIQLISTKIRSYLKACSKIFSSYRNDWFS